VVEALHEQIAAARCCHPLSRAYQPGRLAAEPAKLQRWPCAEWEEEVVFLHKIIEGAADRATASTCPLAGVPGGVIERAKEIWRNSNTRTSTPLGHAKIARTNRKSPAAGCSSRSRGEHPLVDELRTLNSTRRRPWPPGNGWSAGRNAWGRK